MNEMNFTFSDTIAGYVTSFNAHDDSFGVRTSDGREYQVRLTPTTTASVVRNLGEAYLDVTAQMQDMLVPDRFVFLYGIFYPEQGDHTYEVKQITFPALRGVEYVFEQPDWWKNEARAIADFYLRGQFPDGNYDWRNYRTKLSLSGTKTPDYISPDFRQETDTISRLVYGFATAYLLTGEDRFLQAAESGTEYLREHMRAKDEAEGVVYWYHGIDVSGTSERKIFASENGDDYDAIPAYEQIYGLAGPTQTYRVTGDPRILDDIDKTVRLFDRFFKDTAKGGYFSHIDPVTFDPRSESLGRNRARKNWNSVGDHAPAYLINAVLSTGRKDLEEFLVETGNTIVERFPDFDNSPFVQERFFEDWSHDTEWGWQQNRAVVGHNLKIAWNLMRIHSRRPNESYVELARKIAAIMPSVGRDEQRGGWYDVMERTKREGEERYRLVWHDRKAWWQQEQAILAYLILAGCLGDQEYQRLARESAAFYNAMFLDQDEGGVYFNVLANGLPYLLGTERLKGSHSMSGYHSMELCYLASVYTNLLLTKEPLELHFKPKAVSFPDRLLRVAPDLLPPGSVRLAQVWVNDEPYDDFDADTLTVRLPASSDDLRVKVCITPKSDVFDARLDFAAGTATMTLRGRLESDEVPAFRRELDRAVRMAQSWTDQNGTPARIAFVVKELEELCIEAVRELMFTRSQLPVEDGGDFYVIQASETVKRSIVQDSGEQSPRDGDFVFVDDVSDVVELVRAKS